MKNYKTCQKCGAMVAPDGEEPHFRWHARLDPVRPTPIIQPDPRLFDKNL